MGEPLPVDIQMARTFLAALDFQGRLDAVHAFQSIPDEECPSKDQIWKLTRGGDKHPEMTGTFDDVLPHAVARNQAGSTSRSWTDATGGRKAKRRRGRAPAADFDHQRRTSATGIPCRKTGSARGPSQHRGACVARSALVLALAPVRR
jgi:hypothetical protein